MEVHEWRDGWQLWDLIGFLTSIGAFASSVIYRGHGNASWKLTPGLYRREAHLFGAPKADCYLMAEQRMIDTFFDRAQLLLPSLARNACVDRVIAQHYSVPTQLLDWTIDPFIALYFAVENTAASDDCALIFTSPMRRIVDRDQVKFPYFGPITILIPPVIDERVRSQKSVFTIQSYGDAEDFTPLEDRPLKISQPGSGSDPEDQVSVIGKVIIPGDKKQQLKSQLMSIGIDPSLVYPGLQGIGARINAIANISNYGGDGLF